MIMLDYCGLKFKIAVLSPDPLSVEMKPNCLNKLCPYYYYHFSFKICILSPCFL